MMRSRRIAPVVIVLAISALFLSLNVEAQEVAGIRLELNSINGNTVNFDVVEFTDGGGNATTVGLQVIEFGDGATVAGPIVTRTADSYGTTYPAITGVYRGTFSHTYPNPGAYNIRAGDCCAGWPINDTAYYITGYYTGSSDDSVTIWNNLGVVVQQPAAEAIPTLSRGAILFLALALMVVGCWFLRARSVS